MTSMTNDILNNNDGSASSSSCFDKNEFYTENGLIKAQKKDRKSHGKNAANQMEDRNQKIAAQISLLPKKLQAKLAKDAVASSPGKVTNTHVTKLFHNRNHAGQSAIQGLLYQEYDEALLAEEDALQEAWEKSNEEEDEEKEYKEDQYQKYLEKKAIWDLPRDGTRSRFELTCLKEDIDEYEAEMKAKTMTISDDDYEQIRKVVYEDHKYELEHCRSDWDQNKLQWFQKEVDDYERNHDINQPSEALGVWLRYGLTKEQYGANLAYKNNLSNLSAYYEDPDYANHPQYGIDLETDIKNYELDFDAKTQKDAEEDDANDWWTTNCEDGSNEQKESLEFYQTWREIQHENEMDDWRQETKTFEDWCDNKREQDMEDFRQNMIDDRED